jgi:ABC-type multidrug transport system permease subunit
MLSIKIKGKMEGVSRYVFPPVISIKQKTVAKEGQEEDKEEFSFQQYVLPSISIMFLLFICNFVFEDLLRENEGGTLLRMMVSPLRINEFIWSKILAAAILGVLCTFFLIFLGVVMFKIRWGPPFILIVFVLFLNIMIAGFIAFLYSFVRTERQAGALLSTVILVMALLGGSMLPAQFFPPAVQIFSKLTINYWGIEGFYRIMRSDPLRQIIPILLGMASGGILFASIGSHFLNLRLKRGLLK